MFVRLAAVVVRPTANSVRPVFSDVSEVQLQVKIMSEAFKKQLCLRIGNDFSTLYAPLIRDGRMEKFYWAPTREDRVGVCMGIFKEDGVTRAEVEQIVDTFPGQSIDFFGALRARVYDDAVRAFVKGIGTENIGARLVNSKEGRVSRCCLLCHCCLAVLCLPHQRWFLVSGTSCASKLGSFIKDQNTCAYSLSRRPFSVLAAAHA